MIDEEEERRTGRAIVQSKGTTGALELREESRKAVIAEAKGRVQERLAAMHQTAMDALEMGMQSEDEGIRMKALAMFLDRMAPRVGIDRSGEVEEIIVPVGTKMVADEIEKLVAKKIEEARSGNNSEGRV